LAAYAPRFPLRSKPVAHTAAAFCPMNPTPTATLLTTAAGPGSVTTATRRKNLLRNAPPQMSRDLPLTLTFVG